MRITGSQIRLALIAAVIVLAALLVGTMDYWIAAWQEVPAVSVPLPRSGGPVLVAPRIRQALKAKAAECERLYTVVNLDGTLRCAALVPGIVWNPYVSPDDEREALALHLKKLARGR